MSSPQFSAAPTVTRARGIERIWHPGVWGTIVGAVGATVFVTSNRGVLPAPWPVIAVVLWAVALLGYLVCVFLLRRAFVDISRGGDSPGVRVGAKAGVAYIVSVVGMLVLMQVGSRLLDGAGLGDLRPALVVAAVGLHFIPFAAAFHTPMFMSLGLLMTVVGITGLLLGWLWDERAAGGAAVVAGIVMLVMISLDALRWSKTGATTPA